jgi:predicted secreted protein
MIINGKDLMLYVYGDGNIGTVDELYPVACDKTCSLEIDSDILETTVKDSGYWKTFLPSFNSAKITGDGLVDYSKTMGLQSLQSKIMQRTLVVFKLVAELSDTEKVIYGGQGYLTSVTVSGAVGSAASFSYQLTATGEPDIDNTIPVEGGDGTPADAMAQIYPIYFRTTTDQTSYQNDALVSASLILFSIEGVIIFKADGLGPDGESTWDGFDPATGTLSWTFKTENLSRGYILYKK